MLVENPEQFLHESGLLFHINRSVLHPLGYSLGIILGTKVGQFTLHETDNPEGFVFEEEEMATAALQYDLFMSERKSRVIQRGKTLGYILQPIAHGANTAVFKE